MLCNYKIGKIIIRQQQQPPPPPKNIPQKFYVPKMGERVNFITLSCFPIFIPLALESLGFGSYISEVKEVLQECKTVALKRRKASSRLENLGIPEEELLRQQQELFAKVSNAF